MSDSNISPLVPTSDAQDEALTGVQAPGGTGAPATKQEAVARARSEAVTALTKAHRDEFNEDIKARVEAYGFEWSPKPTAAEKAKAEIERLMAEHGFTRSDLP